MMAADTMEALGIPRGQYVVKVNNRKVLDGVMESIGLGGDENAGRRLTVLRAIDKLDKFGSEGVRLCSVRGVRTRAEILPKAQNSTSDAIEKVIAFTDGKIFRASLEIVAARERDELEQIATLVSGWRLR